MPKVVDLLTKGGTTGALGSDFRCRASIVFGRLLASYYGLFEAIVRVRRGKLSKLG